MGYTWLINAGHGGITKNGIYTTAPNKMHTFDDGFVTYEGLINRQIAEKLYKQLAKLGVDFSLVYEDVADTSLIQRVGIVNKLYEKCPSCVLIELHSNASPNHNASGNEIFTSPGQTKSDVLAEIFCKKYMQHFPETPFRKQLIDGDLDKEANFYMLTKTLCPAILFENLFFDNRKEAEFLTSFNGQMAIVDCILDGILEIEDTKPI